MRFSIVALMLSFSLTLWQGPIPAFGEPPRIPSGDELKSLTAGLRSAKGAFDSAPSSQKAARLAALTQKAQERQKAMLAAIEDDPDSVIATALSMSERGSFPAPIQTLLERSVVLEGTALLRAVDYLDRPGKDQMVLSTAPGVPVVVLNFSQGKIPENLTHGGRARVRGILVGRDELAVTHPPEILPASSENGEGPRPNLFSRAMERVLDWMCEKALAYALNPYGAKWANVNVTSSFVPDGTITSNGSLSDLFAKLNLIAPTATWQREHARALQTWASVTPLNFRIVPDNGAYSGSPGLLQGDPNFGDIRLDGFVRTGGFVAYAFYPGGDTRGGDVSVNTGITFKIGADLDLYSVLLHETGHALGLAHSSLVSAVMYPSIMGVYTGLGADDIAGIQAIYGARQPDSYDSGSGNNSMGSATLLTLDGSGAVMVNADLTGLADVDYFKVTAPASFNGTLSASVDARGVSLLAPKVSVYDANGNLLGSAGADLTYGYGTVAVVSVSGLVSGQTYFIAADGATPDVFGMGSYKLPVAFGTGSAVNAPSGLTATSGSATQISLTWTDNATNETGFRVDRSPDGASWAAIASPGANSVSYTDGTVSAGTTYYYRVLAVSGSTLSAPSNTASATTAPPAPGGLTASAVSSSQINLGWSDVSGESGYKIERSLDSGFTWTQISTPAANTASYADTGLVAATSYGYRIRAYNSGGDSAYSIVVNATTLPASDTQAPTAAITAPSSGQTVSGSVTVNASATDNVGVAKVEFYLDGLLKASDPTSPYSFGWDTTMAADGSHSLLAKAYDAAGNVGSSSAVSVTVSNAPPPPPPADTTPPTVAITSPAAGATVSGTVAVSASASDNVGVARVEFYLDGALKATDTSFPYSFSWDTTLVSDGSHTLLAKAADAAGNTGSSATVSVTASNATPPPPPPPSDTTPPTVAITSPSDGSSVPKNGQVKIAVSASDDVGVAKVEIRVDGVLKATLTTAPYTYTWNGRKAAKGPHAIAATATDAAGNSASSGVTVNR